MTPADFLGWPAWVQILVTVMFWPAIFAAAQAAIVLAGDIVRQGKTHGVPVRADAIQSKVTK